MSRHHSLRRDTTRQFGFVIRNLHDSMLQMRFRSRTNMLMRSFYIKMEKRRKKNYFNFTKCILLWQNRYGLIGPWKFDFFFFPLFPHFILFLNMHMVLKSTKLFRSNFISILAFAGTHTIA